MNLNLTLFFQVLFFGGFVWFCQRYVWVPIIGMLEKRRTEIAEGLAAAEQGKHQAEAARNEADQLIGAAKTQASEIIARAEKRAQELVDEARTTAKTEGARLLDQAREGIDTEAAQAREALRAEVGQLAVEAAGQILQREIDAKAHAELLERVAVKL